MDINNLPADAGSENPEGVVEAFFDSLDAPEVEEAPDEAPADEEEPAGHEGTDEDLEEAPEAAESVEEEEEAPVAENNEPNTWEERYKQLQSHSDQRYNQLEQKLAQMDQWASQVYQQQLAQTQAAQEAQRTAAAAAQAPVQNVTRDELQAAVDNDPKHAFVWTATNRPDLVPATIAMAREKHGNMVADEMQVEYNQYMIQQESQQRQAYQAQQEASREAEQAPAQIEQVMVGLIEGISDQYGESFKLIETDFVARASETAPQFKEYMNQQGLEITADALHYFLTKTYNDVREMKLNEAASAPAKPRKVTASEHVERSTAGTAPTDATADELVISELMEGAQALGIDFATPTR